MIDFNQHEKRILSTIGRNAYGKELVQILEKKRDEASSLSGLDRSKDTAAQVEGRLLFVDFANSLIERLSFQRQAPQTLNSEEYE